MPNDAASSASPTVLLACDQTLLTSVFPLFEDRVLDIRHVQRLSEACELISHRRFDLVMIDIFFDGGLQMFDLLRSIRNNNVHEHSRIVCFRCLPPKTMAAGSCDAAVASVAKLIADAEYWDLTNPIQHRAFAESIDTADVRLR